MRLVLQAPGHVSYLSVELGDEIQLRFRHSIYGSMVEEAFRVSAGGLESGQLRYQEPRLAEYYGHEHAVLSGKWWIVERGADIHQNLRLRASRQSEMHVTVGKQSVNLAALVRSGESVPVSLAVSGMA